MGKEKRPSHPTNPARLKIPHGIKNLGNINFHNHLFPVWVAVLVRGGEGVEGRKDSSQAEQAPATAYYPKDTSQELAESLRQALDNSN